MKKLTIRDILVDSVVRGFAEGKTAIQIRKEWSPTGKVKDSALDKAEVKQIIEVAIEQAWI